MKTNVRRILVLCCVLGGTFLFVRSVQASPPGSGWGLIFADEFGGTTLDSMKWNYNYPWGATHNHDAYMLPQNVTLSNGILTESAYNQSYGGKPYTSGAINSNGKFNYKYGYYEANLKTSSTQGAWPAFWMLQDGWPPEIDIMEVPINPSATPTSLTKWNNNVALHYSTSGGNASHGSYYYTGGDTSAAFHTYGVDWQADHMTFYCDGVQKYSTTDTTAISQCSAMYMILNLAIGGWPGDPLPDATWPITYQVNWVRVWEKTSSSFPSSVTWTKAGNGSWDDTTAWSTGSVPLLNTQTITFGSVAATNVTVDWTNSRTVGGLIFNSSVNYTLGSGDESLMLTSATPITSEQPNSNTVLIDASNSTAGLNVINSRLELYNNVTLRSSSKPLVITGGINGLGALRIESGLVVLNGAASYSGATTVTGGTVGLNSTGGLGGGTGNVELGYESNNVVSVAMNSGGTKIQGPTVRLSHGPGSQTTLTQVAGTISATGDMIVGDVGQGTYKPSGGTANIGGKLILGNSAGSSGSVTQSGSASINVGTSTTNAPWADVGLSGTGTYTINGGTLTAYTSSGFNVGDVNSSSGTLNINGGTVRLRDLYVGKYNSAQGVVTQAGGTVNIDISGGGENRIGGYDAASSNAQGTYNISNGNLNAAQNLQIGAYGSGWLNQSGGTVTVSQNTSVGRFSTGVGQLNISGGTFSQNNSAANLIVGDQGTGTLTLSGTGILNNAGGMIVGNAPTANGTVNLNAGGTIISPFINTVGGTSTWYFNGGCLTANADSSNFMQSLTNAFIQAGGAVIDTDIHSILIAQPLLDGGGNGGLTKNSSGMLTLSGNLTYKGTTTINDGDLIISGASVSIGSASILGGSLQVNSPSAAMHDISGGTLIVGDGLTPASLSVDSVIVGILTISPGSTLSINQIPGGLHSESLLRVPEPSTWVLILFTSAGALFIGRRRN